MICVQFPRLLRLLSLLLAASIGIAPVANAQPEQSPPPAAQSRRIRGRARDRRREVHALPAAGGQVGRLQLRGARRRRGGCRGQPRIRSSALIEITAKTDVGQGLAHRALPGRQDRQGDVSLGARKSAAVPAGLQTMAASGRSTMSLDRLEVMLAINGAEKKARTVPVKNDPPAHRLLARSAAILVPIDGAPVWRPWPGTGLERVLNTRAVRGAGRRAPGASTSTFRRLRGGAGIAGPWTVARACRRTSRRWKPRLAQQEASSIP